MYYNLNLILKMAKKYSGNSHENVNNEVSFKLSSDVISNCAIQTQGFFPGNVPDIFGTTFQEISSGRLQLRPFNGDKVVYFRVFY